MNDFTKEELQEIKRCLKYMIQGGVTPYSTLTIILNRKVQNMIEKFDVHGSSIYKDATKIYTSGVGGGVEHE